MNAFDTYVRTARLQHSAALGALIGSKLVAAWQALRRASSQVPASCRGQSPVVRVSEQLRWAYERFSAGGTRGTARPDQGVPTKAVRDRAGDLA